MKKWFSYIMSFFLALGVCTALTSCGNQPASTTVASAFYASFASSGTSSALSTSSASFALVCDSVTQTSTPTFVNPNYLFSLPNNQTCVLSLNAFTLATGESFRIATGGQAASIGAGTTLGTYLGSLGTNATITPSFLTTASGGGSQTLTNGALVVFNYQTFTIALSSSTPVFTPTASSSAPYYTLMGLTKSISASFSTTSNALSGLSLSFLDSQFSASPASCSAFSPTATCNLSLSWRTSVPSFANNAVSLNNTGSYVNNFNVASNMSAYGGTSFANTLSYAALNSSSSTSSYPYIAIHPWAAFSSSMGNACALDSSGYLWCWGNDAYNQLTDGMTNSTGAVQIRNCYSSSSPTAQCATNYMTGVVGVHAGAYICVLLNTGTVTCWGYNAQGQTGQTASASITTPTAVAGLSNVIAVGGNQNAACALVGSSLTSQSGTVYCWGANGGSIGNGTAANTSTPSRVCAPTAEGGVSAAGCGGVYLNNIVAISNGEASQITCALNTSGNVYCWGFSSSYQLGNNSTAVTYVPVKVLAGAQTTCATYLCHISAIYSGYGSTCAIDDTAHVYCWGLNNFGQLGTGNTSSPTTPVEVLSGVTSATCGTYLCNVATIALNYESSCALLTSGGVYCWGVSTQGNLGNNTVSGAVSTPVQVLQQSGGTCTGGYLCNIVALSGADNSTCALDTSGRIFCWGNNDGGSAGIAGILGVKTGTATQSPIPRIITNITGIR